MVDWHESRTTTYEYYQVDPDTWTDMRKLDNVTTSTIDRDMTSDTLGSATIEIDGMDLGEFYVRTYLVTIQNGLRYREPLGTHLVQTSSSSFDGKIFKPSLTAYSPLLELKDVYPALGYACRKGAHVLEQVYSDCLQYCRAPVVPGTADRDQLEIDFIADPSDTWLKFDQDLLSNIKYRFDVDEMGTIMFAPEQETEAMQPVFVYNDDNSSILYPEITKTVDLFGIPNTLEVVYSGDDRYLTATAVNDDVNSLVSTVNRGRTVYNRETNPGLLGVPTQGELLEYAEKLLKQKSEIECELTYSHGYNGVRVGDCVRLNYKRAGLNDVKARVIKQKIKCDTECRVDETAVFKKKFWG